MPKFVFDSAHRDILAGFPRNFVLYMDTLAADATTAESGGNRDEVYMLVMGDTPSGLVSTRLPRRPGDDDYYEFFPNTVHSASDAEGWTNRDQVGVGCPRFWCGELRNGEQANFVVIVCEQDNKQAHAIKAVLKGALDLARPLLSAAAGTLTNGVPLIGDAAKAAVEGAVKGLNGLVDSIHETDVDEVIGTFHVTVSNVRGDIQVVWIDVPDAGTVRRDNAPLVVRGSVAGQRSLAQFDMRSPSGGRYRAGVCAMRTGQGDASTRMYLGRTTERSGEPVVRFDGAYGPVDLGRGEVEELRVAAPTFRWAEDDRTEGPDGTNLVTVRRSSTDDRGIDIRFWRVVSFEGGGILEGAMGPHGDPLVDDRYVVACEHVNYGGRRRYLDVGDYSWVEAAGVRNDSVTSLRIPRGVEVTLFEHANFQGASRRLYADVAWLGADWNDRVSSMKVRRL